MDTRRGRRRWRWPQDVLEVVSPGAGIVIWRGDGLLGPGLRVKSLVQHEARSVARAAPHTGVRAFIAAREGSTFEQGAR